MILLSTLPSRTTAALVSSHDDSMARMVGTIYSDLLLGKGKFTTAGLANTFAAETSFRQKHSTL
jgi:hypothetical protein